MRASGHMRAARGRVEPLRQRGGGCGGCGEQSLVMGSEVVFVVLAVQPGPV